MTTVAEPTGPKKTEMLPSQKSPRSVTSKGSVGRRSIRAVTSVGVLVALLMLWQIATHFWDEKFFPTPLEIIDNLPSVLVPRNADSITEAPLFVDVGGSLYRMAAGFALGMAAGILIGVLLGWFQTTREYVAPIVEFLRSIPATAVLPIFILLFGLGPGMQILFIAWGVSWFVLINTTTAVAEIHPTMMDFCRTFRLSTTKILFGVVLPSASPKIFAGMRIGLTAAMILIVTSEFMGATNGIGYQLIQDQRRFQVLDMWSWMLVIAIAGFLANTVLEAIEARVLRWHTASRKK